MRLYVINFDYAEKQWRYWISYVSYSFPPPQREVTLVKMAVNYIFSKLMNDMV